jgi:hypothetical protein
MHLTSNRGGAYRQARHAVETLISVEADYERQASCYTVYLCSIGWGDISIELEKGRKRDVGDTVSGRWSREFPSFLFGRTCKNEETLYFTNKTQL